MVVMMHSTLGVQEATGEPSWMGALVAFAKPFRMPDFFLISGLFLARVIDWPWRRYLDTKVVHFAYFYVLWVTIQFVVKAHHFTEDGLAWPASWKPMPCPTCSPSARCGSSTCCPSSSWSRSSRVASRRSSCGP